MIYLHVTLRKRYFDLWFLSTFYDKYKNNGYARNSNTYNKNHQTFLQVTRFHVRLIILELDVKSRFTCRFKHNYSS